MSKTYPAPPFQEVYQIQLPYSVREDTALNWIDRVAYWFFVHHKGDTAKVIAELGIKDRQFRYIKNKLASRGHIARVEERGQVKYLALDLSTAYFLKIQHLRAASQVGFKLITDHNIVSLQSKHTLPHILHVMEVLEWTYRNGKQTIKKPHHLLARSCNTGVTEPRDFVKGFWEKDLQEAAEKKRHAEQQDYKAYKAAELETMRDMNFAKYLKSLPEERRKNLEARAAKAIEEEQGPFLPFIGKRVQNMVLLERMKKIAFEDQSKPGNA